MTTRKGRPVVVTGVGVIAPVGLDADSFFSSLLEGKAEHKPIDTFDASGFKASIGGQIRGFEPLTYVKKKKKLKLMGPNITYAIGAAAMAAEQAGLSADAVDGERLGVTLGSRTRISDFAELEKCVLSSLDESGKFDYKRYATEGRSHVYPLSMLRNLPNMAAAHLSIMYKALGPTDSITNGAPSALQAVGESLRTIERGDADMMITGGSDSLVTPLDLCQLTCLGTLMRSKEVGCLPFDENAGGGMAGEGAAIFIIEAKEHAKARGATILAELVGFAEGFEPNFPQAGQGKSKTWQRAMQKADCSIKDIGAVALSGSGYKPWDEFELASAASMGNDVPMWSSRAHIGFAGAAMSALDLAAAILSARKCIVPVTANCKNPIEQAKAVNLVRDEALKVSSPVRLVTSYNRAGANAALLISGEAVA